MSQLLDCDFSTAPSTGYTPVFNSVSSKFEALPFELSSLLDIEGPINDQNSLYFDAVQGKWFGDTFLSAAGVIGANNGRYLPMFGGSTVGQVGVLTIGVSGCFDDGTVLTLAASGGAVPSVEVNASNSRITFTQTSHQLWITDGSSPFFMTLAGNASISGTNTGDQTPTSLGLVIGTNVQAWDADLDAIAGLSGTSGLLSKTGANSWALDTNTYATVAYADSLVVGLLDDRGNFDASGNAFPSSGGSGTAGAILKGDLWTISVAGTLGGSPVTAGDLVRALVDTPGQTAGNWAISETNIGYTALNAALNSGQIYVGSGSNIGTARTLSGDVTVDNLGVTAIGAGKVTASMLDTAYVPTSRTVNGKALSGNITLGLASSDFANQGTTTTVLHGNAAGNPSFAVVTPADAAGNTSGSGNFALVGGPTFTADTTFSGAAIVISGDISAAAWTTNGLRIRGVPGTLTDTSSVGVVATAYTDVLGGNTINSTNANTFTNYFTMYAKDPVQGTAVLTNKWAIGADSIKIGTSNQLTVSNAGVLTMTGDLLFNSAANLGSATLPALSSFVGNTTQYESVTQSAGLITHSLLGSATNISLKLLPKGTGGVLFPSGAKNTPGIAFTADSTTGFFYAGSNSITYTTANTDQFQFQINVLQARSTGSYGWSNGAVGGGTDLYLSRRGAATLNLGLADASSPIAQSISVQGVATGTSNVAGVDWTFKGSQGTGTGAGGSIIFQTAPVGTTGSSQNALATCFSLASTGAATFTSQNDAVGLTVTGGSVTGSGTSSLISATVTWNTTGGPTAFVLNATNTASSATAKLMDLQIGGSTRFYVDKNGVFQFSNASVIAQAFGQSSTRFAFGTTTNHPIAFFTNNGQYGVTIDTSYQVRTNSGGSFAVSSSSTDSNTAADTALRRNAAGVWAMDNGTAGQWASLLCGVRDAGLNTTVNGLTLGHQTSGTKASITAGMGIGILFNIDTTTTSDQNAAQISAQWSDPTHATRTGDIIFSNVLSAAALAETFRIKATGLLVQPTTLTAGGTTGNQTINKPTGSVNIAAGGTTVTVTDSLASATSLIFPVILSNDTTAQIKNVVRHAGSFDINLVAAVTAETIIGFWVINV